jgi:hypothetical protein
MNDVSSNSIVFADRPVRAAGHVLTNDFLKEWDEGGNSFAHDPPNATLSVLGADGTSVEDAVVVLKSPKLDGNKLTFEVSVLEGGLSKATGPASLFIDWFAARGYGGRAFVAGGGGWHGAWYAHPAAGFERAPQSVLPSAQPPRRGHTGPITIRIIRLRLAATTPIRPATEWICGVSRHARKDCAIPLLMGCGYVTSWSADPERVETRCRA